MENDTTRKPPIGQLRSAIRLTRMLLIPLKRIPQSAIALAVVVVVVDVIIIVILVANAI